MSEAPRAFLPFVTSRGRDTESSSDAMKPDKAIAAYRRMRKQPLWTLLAADNGPTVLALLLASLPERERSLPASIFLERIERELERMRNLGDDFPHTAQQYVAGWLAAGYLERRFPPGSQEEQYELATPAVQAIRFISGLVAPHSAATESRLSLVIGALTRLSDDTDNDQVRRVARLRWRCPTCPARSPSSASVTA